MQEKESYKMLDVCERKKRFRDNHVMNRNQTIMRTGTYMQISLKKRLHFKRCTY